MPSSDLKCQYAKVNADRKERRKESRRKWWREFKCWWHCRHHYVLAKGDRWFECSLCGKFFHSHCPYPPDPGVNKKGD